MLNSAIEPTVIDQNLINESINEQLNPDIAEIVRREGIQSGQITKLRLDFKNILRIDNLWVYENITKLQLDNNIIEKIENIHSLTNLEWLDLSFNNIAAIEGLETLSKLTDLSLNNNRISRIENMDALVKLQAFSIGNNNITSLDDFSYLQRFDHLRILNAAGNPIASNGDYKSYCIAHLKNLKYLDYRLFDENEITAAKDQFKDSLDVFEQMQKALQEEKDRVILKNELQELLKKAHVPDINNLFDRMFESSEYSSLSKIMELVYEEKEHLRSSFGTIVHDLQAFAIANNKELDAEASLLNACLEDTKETKDKELQDKIQLFFHQKKELFKIVQNSKDAMEADNSDKKLRSAMQGISDYLMDAEMVLTEQFGEVIQEYTNNSTQITNNLIEFGELAFSKLRKLENDFNERVREKVMTEYEKLTDNKESIINAELRELLGNKDILINSIEASHQSNLIKLNQQEEILVSECKSSLENLIQKVKMAEINRSRARVWEIVALVQNCQREIDQYQN